MATVKGERISALTWLLIPLMTALGACLWAWYTSRPHPADVWTDVERHDRLRAEFARIVAGPRATDRSS
ncbi:hypothetical protein [Streptomyces sp. NPDC003032]